MVRIKLALMNNNMNVVPYLLGWKAYFGLAQTPRIWRTLDEWLRHRLRAIQLKHLKRRSSMYRELRNLALPPK